MAKHIDPIEKLLSFDDANWSISLDATAGKSDVTVSLSFQEDPVIDVDVPREVIVSAALQWLKQKNARYHAP
jgi:hypothetical protein